jgi:hypothetical protein
MLGSLYASRNISGKQVGRPVSSMLKLSVLLKTVDYIKGFHLLGCDEDGGDVFLRNVG